LVFILAISVMALFVGCKGDTGPTGPQGEQGDKGDPGEPGGGGTTRTVLSGTVDGSDIYWEVPLPEISFDDLALVTVFIKLNDGEWDELPTSWDECTNPPTCTEFQAIYGYATLVDHSQEIPPKDNAVGFLNCGGLGYIIIIIE
jgi:hypothetical protein